MKYFVQFFHRAVWPIGTLKIIEACGDRSIIRIDARVSKPVMGKIAAAECEKRGYIAWQIIAGESLLSAKPLHSPNYINTGKIDNSAASATHGA